MSEFGTSFRGANPPVTVRDFVAYDKKIYGFARTAPKLMYFYDTQTSAWELTNTKLPVDKVGFDHHIVGNKMYCIGGDSREKSNNIYDFSTGSWTVGADKPTGTERLFSTVVGSKIYCFSGYNKTLQVYDTISNTWANETPLRKALSDSGCVAYGTKIFVIGGYNASIAADVQIYDTITKQWSDGAPMPIPKYGFGCDVLGSKIYCVAGRIDFPGTSSKSVSIYDIESNTWSAAPDLVEIQDYSDTNIIDGKLYSMGYASNLIIYTILTSTHTVTEQYKDQNGTSVKANAETCLQNGDDYTATAPSIAGYNCIGYMLDGGELTAGTIATIANVQADHVVTFVYAPDMPSTHTVTEQYQDQNGAAVKASALIVVQNGEDYTATATAIAGYNCIGYKLDGGELTAGTTATIANVQANHIVAFVYQLASGRKYNVMLTVQGTIELA